MAAGAAPGQELCPYCGRPFKRLRAHLPHCKAAPPSPPGSEPRPKPASAPAAVLGTGPRSGSAAGPSAAPHPGTGRGPAASGSRSRALRDVARSLDLHPEEVEGVPKLLQKGVKVVIEKNRARVVRDKEPRSRAGSRGEGKEPGPAPHPQRRKTAQKSKSEETRSQGAVRNGAGSSKGEKSSLKATKVLQEPPESRNSPGDLVQQEGRDKFTAGEEQVHLEFRGGSKPPVCALHPEKLHLSLTEAFGGQGPSKNELSSLQRPRAGGEGAPEPVLSLALLHTPQMQPTCSSRASGRSPTGLEWFPDLYPDYEGLRIFPGKRFHEDVRIAAETPKGGLAQGQQGPLSERPLMEVRLGELHTWISTCNFSPQGLLGAVQRAWSSYCAKYIHVRQGGPAGISMLLAGYCLLSYGWNYQHLKRHRWRKYH
ncbi:mitochondrial nucleoid-associated protein 1 [Sylvia atricapilla]